MKVKYNAYRQHRKRVLGACLLLCGLLWNPGKASAQLNPMGTMYFQNQYLANPAMAGREDGWTINLANRKKWTSMPGAPSSQAFTGEYGFGNNVSVGLNVYSTKTGLLKHTSVQGTYAYHVPLADEQHLHLGLSVGATRQSIDMAAVVGDVADPSVARFNDNNELLLDGNFGAAYTLDKFTVQVAALHLNNILGNKTNQEKVINYPTFFTAASYRFNLDLGSQSLGLEPKVAYRGMQGTANILDAGANLSFLNNMFQVFGLYHSTKAATAGFTVGYKERIAITGIYSTATPEIKDYSSGGFELGLRLSLNKD